MKSIKTHFITLMVATMTMTVYLYSQVNVYSLLFGIVGLYALSKYGVRIFWKSIFLSWLYLSAGFILFYGLFIHQGDGTVFQIPGHLPFVSGPIELSSILYGVLLGGCITLGLYFFSLPAKELRTGSFSFYIPGIWRNSTLLLTFLSHFVNFFFDHQSKFEKKIANRNLRLSRFQKAKLLLHDASIYGLEHSFMFAEILETRGFSLSSRRSNSKRDFFLLSIAMVMIALLISYRIYHQLWFILLSVGLTLIVLGSIFKTKNSSHISKGHRVSLHVLDCLIILYSVAFSVMCLWTNIHHQSSLNQNRFDSYFQFDSSIQIMFLIHLILMLLMISSRSKSSS